MALAPRTYGWKFDGAGQTVNQSLKIAKMYVDTAGTAGDYVFKDVNGNVILDDLRGPANETLIIDWPFGYREVYGLELDALPTGGTVQIIIA